MSATQPARSSTRESTARREVRFASGDANCVAWHYPGSNGGCVVMAGGLGVTKEPGTDRFAARFHDAGFTVLAFDHRHFGASGGRPRQVARIGEQLADWRNAIAFAGTLPGVDPGRVAAWSFSASAGHLVRVAARGAGLAAVIGQSPSVDGPATTRNAVRHQRPPVMLRMIGRGLLDALGGLLGREPLLVPLAGPPGTLALLTTPDAVDGGRILDPDGRYPRWQQAIAARAALTAGSYRPGRDAARVRCPLLMVVCDDDRTAPIGPAVRAARRAPRGEVLHLPGGHYAPFLDAHEQAVEGELAFLRRHLAGTVRPITG
ncbi:alpha/beta hydrolase [Plantactinospora siamensis]|uniref:Alpha/beta hydrolase n=1 Tax=Plantactinospora siamensis TaxID=555372 RepID=A0ABV6NYP1_9ACTN